MVCGFLVDRNVYIGYCSMDSENFRDVGFGVGWWEMVNEASAGGLRLRVGLFWFFPADNSPLMILNYFCGFSHSCVFSL